MDNVSIQNSNDNLFFQAMKNRRIDFWVIYVSHSWTLLGLNSRDVATILSKIHASRSFRLCQMYRIRLTLMTSEEATIVVSKRTCTSTTCAILMTTLKCLVLNPQSIGYLPGIWYGKNMSFLSHLFVTKQHTVITFSKMFKSFYDTQHSATSKRRQTVKQVDSTTQQKPLPLKDTHYFTNHLHLTALQSIQLKSVTSSSDPHQSKQLFSQVRLFVVQEFAVQPNDDMIHHNDSPQVPYLSTYPHRLAAIRGMSLKSEVVIAWLVVESNASRVRYFGRT